MNHSFALNRCTKGRKRSSTSFMGICERMKDVASTKEALTENSSTLANSSKGGRSKCKCSGPPINSIKSTAKRGKEKRQNIDINRDVQVI